MRPTDTLLCVLCSLALAAGPLGCGGDDGPGDPDATPPPIDGPPAGDAAPPDAGQCAGEAIFSGSYIDWDGNSSGPLNTLDAEVAEAGDPDNSFTITAPNGRVSMCLPDDAVSTVRFTHPDYLPLGYAFDPDANGSAFDLRGLSPARADELLIGLGVTRDPATAQVLVAVRLRTGDLDTVGAPAVGAGVSLGNGSAGSFVDAGGGTYGAGDTLVTGGGDTGAFVLFANTEVGAGQTTVTVTPPGGQACDGPDTIELAAGEVAATTFVCGAPSLR